MCMQATREAETAAAQLADARRSSATLEQQLQKLTATQQAQAEAAAISSEDTDGNGTFDRSNCNRFAYALSSHAFQSPAGFV